MAVNNKEESNDGSLVSLLPSKSNDFAAQGKISQSKTYAESAPIEAPEDPSLPMMTKGLLDRRSDSDRDETTTSSPLRPSRKV